MKKNARNGFALLLAAITMVALGACPTDGDNGKEKTPTNPVYDGFFNYPTGRVDTNAGRLTIRNTIASEVLLFYGTVDKDNYIGTVNSLGSVQVKMPEEKFYTIIAVEKANYEERRAQAAQFSSLTYYSSIQGYTISVSPSSAYGGGNWVFDNNTTYWVQIKKADLSMNYAVIAPDAKRVTVPIEIGTNYDYYVYFSKELKYNGKVIALVEATDPSQANTALVSNANPTFTTTITNTIMPNSNIKPAVMVINNTAKTVRVHRSQTLMTNGAPSGDFAVAGGQRQLISGFEIDDDTATINFKALAWGSDKFVPQGQSMKMVANKVYEITIPLSEDASQITVTEVDSSKYYN